MNDPRTECDFIGSHLMNGNICDRCGQNLDTGSDLAATDNQSQDEPLKSAPKSTNDKEE